MKMGDEVLSATEKAKWLTDRGYEELQSGFTITIAVRAGAKYGYRTAYNQKTIGWDEINGMTRDELDQYDQLLWMKARSDIRKFLKEAEEAE
ncbi:hypothetical protein [Staphylococcus aureus]|uniref:hypothetical protein n=1 Tax=Staphylococcus aureus TaxID=1280 RepID=UPI0020C0D58E|nr:hypothetical protein [Staphylococcus aureus]